MNAQLFPSLRPARQPEVSVRRGVIAATVLIAASFGAAQPAFAGEPEVRLTSPDSDVRISRRGSYVITWSSTDLPPNTALSLQLTWTAMDTGVRPGGAVQAVREARLITTVLDAAAMKTFMGDFKPKVPYGTIETGRYVWDVAKFCRQNTDNGRSVCDRAPVFHLQVILRAANDPCGDNLRCDKPRALFKTYASRGAISFSD